jgi:hypothetical protein
MLLNDEKAADRSHQDSNKSSLSNYSDSKGEPRRAVVTKQAPLPAIDQSVDIDAILQGRAYPQVSSKPLQPTQVDMKTRAVVSKRDDSSNWLDDIVQTPPTRDITPKYNTRDKLWQKPTVDQNIDDFFSNASNNRDPITAKPPLSSTKSMAKQYYLGNTRYKPGVFCSFEFIAR